MMDLNNGNRYNGTYEYPAWGIAFGWFLALISIIMMPITMIVIWFQTPNVPNVSASHK